MMDRVAMAARKHEHTQVNGLFTMIAIKFNYISLEFAINNINTAHPPSQPSSHSHTTIEANAREHDHRMRAHNNSSCIRRIQ